MSNAAAALRNAARLTRNAGSGHSRQADNLSLAERKANESVTVPYSYYLFRIHCLFSLQSCYRARRTSIP